MSWEADVTIDRRRLKRSLLRWRLAAIAAAVGIGLALFARFDRAPLSDYVARIDVEGLILADDERDDALRAAARDKRAKALIVAIDSPGGTFVGGENLYRALRKVAAEKPVVAVMGGLATSAGYMAAVAAEHLIASRGTLTGSIGVILQTADVTEMLDKLGIKPETVKSSPLKAQPNPLEPFTPAAREATEAVVRDLYGQFVDIVVERRKMERPRVEALADGRVFSGRQAAELGLIDGVGGEDEARAWLADKHGLPRDIAVRTIEIKRDRPGLRAWLEDLVGKALFSERLRLDGAISVWHPIRWR